jgi:hypothetical protein
MNECRILWSRYQLAMERRELARSATEQAAWWAEANEWLRRYFDAIDQQLEREFGPISEDQPAELKPVAPRVLLSRPRGRPV